MVPSPSRRQRGVTLLISLIMLSMLTVFAVAMIRLSSSSMLIAGNMAVQRQLTDSVQQAIETELNSPNFVNDAVNKTGIWAAGVTSYSEPSAQYNGYTITLTRPTCLTEQQAPGWAATEAAITLKDTYWEVTATGTDPLSGASVSLTQGIRITLPANNCVL